MLLDACVCHTSATSTGQPTNNYAAHVQAYTQRYARAFASGEQVGGLWSHHEALAYRTLSIEASLAMSAAMSPQRCAQRACTMHHIYDLAL